MIEVPLLIEEKITPLTSLLYVFTKVTRQHWETQDRGSQSDWKDLRKGSMCQNVMVGSAGVWDEALEENSPPQPPPPPQA